MTPVNSAYNNVPQTAVNQKPQKRGNAVFDSALDIGKTVAGGVGVGLVSGGLVSLIPFDNTEFVETELRNVILQAAEENETVPDSLKSAAEQFGSAKEFIKAKNDYIQIEIKELLLSEQLKLAEALDDDSIKNTLPEVAESLKGIGINIKSLPAGGNVDSNMLESLKTEALLEITNAINKNTQNVGEAAKTTALENIINAKNSFIESISNFVKNADSEDVLLNSVKKAASNASRLSLIQKAVSFAVMVALIAKLFDIFSNKKPKDSKQQNPAALQNIPQNPAQAPLNVLDIFANQASASAQNTNFNKFMTLG